MVVDNAGNDGSATEFNDARSGTRNSIDVAVTDGDDQTVTKGDRCRRLSPLISPSGTGFPLRHRHHHATAQSGFRNVTDFVVQHVEHNLSRSSTRCGASQARPARPCEVKTDGSASTVKDLALHDKGTARKRPFRRARWQLRGHCTHWHARGWDTFRRRTFSPLVIHVGSHFEPDGRSEFGLSRAVGNGLTRQRPGRSAGGGSRRGLGLHADTHP